MNTTYKVQAGDTIAKIAKRNNITQAELLAANPKLTTNGRTPNQIRLGEPLSIPQSKFSGTLTPTDASTPCPLCTVPTYPCDDCLYEALGATTKEDKERLKPYIEPLKDTFKRNQIDNPAKQAIFLGEMKHETTNFTKFTEGADWNIVEYGSKPYDLKGKPQKLEHPGKTPTYKVQLRERQSIKSKNKYTGKEEWRASTDAKIKNAPYKTVEIGQDEMTALDASRLDYFQYLNQHSDYPGAGIDNSIYKGRGAFQLTHYGAYNGFTTYRKEVGDTADYTRPENAAKLASDPALITDSAGWFWTTHMPKSIKNATDLKDVDTASKVINSRDTDTFPVRKQNSESMYTILSKPECNEVTKAK